jgi:Na+/H+-dicarboxylate symporter
MYEFLSVTHNLLRWILLPVVTIVLILSYSGWLANKPYGKLDNAFGGTLVGLAHTQLLIGLLLYMVYSPITQVAFSDFGAAMKDTTLRLYAVEHILTMIIAIVLIQLGRTFSKKAATPLKRHKTIALYTTFALLLILSRMPNWKF